MNNKSKIDFAEWVIFNTYYKLVDGKLTYHYPKEKDTDFFVFSHNYKYSIEDLLKIYETSNNVKSTDWNDFATKLKEELGESLIEEEHGEDDPLNWWLVDVTVQDIIDFSQEYYNQK